MNIRNIVASALTDAQSADFAPSKDKGELHRERSKQFVESLSSRLLEQCAGNGAVAALSKHHDDHRHRFGVNELLFDVAVVEYDTVNSGASGKELAVITKGLWAVESEMAKDKREAMYDFNKLVLAESENKLFVGPRVADEADYLRVLGACARHCNGRVYVALIPHPEKWLESGAADVVAWEWEAGEWVALT